MVAVERHLFQTGAVPINLNDGEPVIAQQEFLFGPGMTVEKEFFLENQSSCDVYYKLYLDDVAGGLAEIIEVEIREGDRVLYRGRAADPPAGREGPQP